MSPAPETRPSPARALASLLERRLVAVLRLASAEEALHAGRAVLAGGARLVEVTLTTPGAYQVVETLAREAPQEALIGVGTVTHPAELDRALDAGAAFAISPDVSAEVVSAAREKGLLHVPGALTPSEVLAARRLGAAVVKLFPIASVGGAGHVRALRGPIPDVPFLVSGGVDLDTLDGFFAAGASAVGLTTTLLVPELVRAGDFAAITELTRAWLARLARIPVAKLPG